jgi:ribonuclease J
MNQNNQKPRVNGPKPGPKPAGKKPAPKKNGNGGGRSVSRGAAIRAQKRSLEDAQKMLDQYTSAAQKNERKPRANQIVEDFDKLKITFLGGLEDVGEKNMTVIEYQNDAIILDCGNNLGVDLPGINYEIADPTYLESIRHKIKGYVITHGHLDHIGGLKHIVPKFPATVYGTRYTIGIVEKTFEDVPAGQEHYIPKTIIMNMDNHERLKVGQFFIEFLRLTHAIPDAAAAVVKTPVGTVVAAGDFRLDPEPLDQMPSDKKRLKELGDEGVLALLSDSTNAEKEGRTPTEHTLQQSFIDIIKNAQGRVMVAVFSSNMNRTQMIINAAVESGRKVALDGRSMMAYAEIAVRQGILKVPKGTIMAMKDAANVPDEQLLVMCTGGQGEPNAALQRMSEGNHQYLKLKPGDTVVVSSTPIPGNEVRYDAIGNNLAKLGVHLFRHPTHEIDGCGPLHVSGHGRREELREMIQLVRPKFHIPVHGGMLRRRYHAELAIEEGWKRENVILANNGESYLLSSEKAELAGEVPHGSLLVDQTGAIVSNVVVKDRIVLAGEGMVAVVLTIDRKSGALLTSPDILTRGFIYIRDSEELMNGLRTELRRAVQQRYKRVDLDRFKQELKDHVTHYLYEQTQRSPIVIPVVNVIGGGNAKNGDKNVNQKNAKQAVEKTPEQLADEQQKRFAELRAKLLQGSHKTE